MGKKQERLKNIIKLLQDEPNISIKKLAQDFSVSEMTIRRDLADLEASSLLSTKPYVNPLALSGAFSPDSLSPDTLPSIQIGRLASTLVENNDIIISDSGPAASYMCSTIQPNLNVTVLCYDFNTLTALHGRSNITTIFAGGRCHASDGVFESQEGIDLLKRHRASKVFFTAEGLHSTLGATCTRSYLAALKRAAAECAGCRILLADSTAFDRIYPDFFLSVQDIDILITDKTPAENWRRLLSQLKIQVMTAD